MPLVETKEDIIDKLKELVAEYKTNTDPKKSISICYNYDYLTERLYMEHGINVAGGDMPELVLNVIV